jgi:hypothetical protein
MTRIGSQRHRKKKKNHDVQKYLPLYLCRMNQLNMFYIYTFKIYFSIFSPSTYAIVSQTFFYVF